uniref:Uncharacterized protein n=1 Tax=Tanacetum cinerariifolium TaxID=118510 RepID=A0A6L2KEZ5_TANCI|nr:hypothetical protein [Tanacetum cinerariifolium]
MIGCKVMRTLVSVEIEIVLILRLSCCLEDPYKALRQAYLVGTDTESEPFEGFWHVWCEIHVIGFHRLLSPNHPLTHTTPALVPSLRRTARVVVRVLPAMSPGLSVGIADVEAMFDLAFRKRFRSSYNSLPSPTLLVWKRYRRTVELILDTDSEDDEEVEESLDSDSMSEDAEDEGPTVEDEDPAAGDKGLAAGDEGLDMRVKSRSLDDEGHMVESDVHGLGEEDEAVPEGNSSQLRLCRQLTFEIDPKDGMVYIDVPAYPPPAPPAQTPLSPEWSSGSFPISATPSIVHSPISSPMISLTVPSPIASPVATSIATIPVDERTSSTALQRELQEMRGRVTALEQERDRRER